MWGKKHHQHPVSCHCTLSSCVMASASIMHPCQHSTDLQTSLPFTSRGVRPAKISPASSVPSCEVESQPRETSDLLTKGQQKRASHFLTLTLQANVLSLFEDTAQMFVYLHIHLNAYEHFSQWDCILLATTLALPVLLVYLFKSFPRPCSGTFSGVRKVLLCILWTVFISLSLILRYPKHFQVTDNVLPLSR